MSVHNVRVREVLRLERRAVQVEPSREYVEVGVRSFGRGIFHKEPVEGASLGNKRVFRIAAGDLVISNVFAWEGAIAVASEADTGMIGSHRFMTFVPTDERLDVRWAAWFFLSETGLDLIRKASPGSAGRNRTLAIDRFEALEIPLPSIEHQRQIASDLDRCHGQLDHIAARREAAMIAPTLMQSARGKFASPDGIAALHGVEHENMLLGEVADFVNGTSYDRGQLDEEGDPIIRISNISDTTSPYLHTREVFDQRFWVEPGDLLVSWSASFKSIIWPGPPGVLNQHIFNVRERGEVDRRFLRHLIEAVFAELRKQAVGIGMMHLRRDAFLKQRVCVPSLETQRAIAERLDAIEMLTSQTETLQQRSIQLLAALRTSIPNHALAG
jgi:restriction endonuclease S subunit